jgi:hypothetical protein
MADLVPEISQMINRFMTEIGLSEAQTFNAERKGWYWKKGSANMEVFVRGQHQEVFPPRFFTGCEGPPELVNTVLPQAAGA